MSAKWMKPARKVHKWLGYLLALQLLAWLLGGLVMSAIPLEKVHGKHLANRTLENPYSLSDYTAWQNITWSAHQTTSKVELLHFLNTPLIKITHQTGEIAWLNGRTALPFEPPTEADIRKQAMAHLMVKDSPIRSVKHLSNGPAEAGHKDNIWQVIIADSLETTLYFDAQSGLLTTVRSHLWRIFDFFWMLHIMDYDERENFNNPLLISFAATSVLFCIAGIVLLFQSPPWRKKRKRLR
ncbi:hypothetical protein PALB_20530 [Pseudoalteromonas luteoviolacea B = ATCC 29581]|nr:hypothetical protein PALB_20530 [Pseudoalteromonas luteoviolacea B = ATCC 29581]